MVRRRQFETEKGWATFNVAALNNEIINRLKAISKGGKRRTKNAIYEELDNKYYFGVENVKRWVQGRSAPSDMAKIEHLAEYFSKDVDTFLIYEDSKRVHETSEIVESKKGKDISELKRMSFSELRLLTYSKASEYGDKDRDGAEIWGNLLELRTREEIRDNLHTVPQMDTKWYSEMFILMCVIP